MISVILPTYNRKHSLMMCLASLERQSLSREEFEVIVVDDGSTDGTREVLESYRKASTLKTTVVLQERRGPGAARNRGVSAAHGAILAFLEDDVVPAPDWLAAGRLALEEPGIDAAEGLTRVEGEELRVFDSPEQLSFLPCNLFVRKQTFIAAGGYDEEFFDRTLGLFFREDADFGFKLLESGRQIVKAPGAVVTHPAQFAAASSPWKHVRRYYFDPLLGRKHPRLYREQIEIKRVEGVRIPRPFHYAACGNVAGWLLFAVAVVRSSLPGAIAAGIIIISSVFIMQYRYSHRWAPLVVSDVARLVAFFSLPFYYWYWHIRGCIRFRNWKTLF